MKPAFIGALVCLVLLGLPGTMAGRPVEESPRFPDIQLYSEPELHRSGRALGAASQDTVYFGGTFWNADSARWQAVRDSVWTFDTGVGSHYDYSAPGVNPTKDPRLHASMEGWVGIDNTYYHTPYFRRMAVSDFPDTAICVGEPAGLGGSYSFWAGVTQFEADSLCFVAGQGYGDSWTACIEHPFDYDSGDVTLAFDYVVETEPGFDFAWVTVDTSGALGPYSGVLVAQYDGDLSGRETVTLVAGDELPSSPQVIRLKFCFLSDGAYSDEDGVYPTRCGGLAVDNIAAAGGGIDHYADFETGDDGWSLEGPMPGGGGEWSNIVDLADLPATMAACECVLSDSVLVFEDLDDPDHHGNFQYNVAVSPWIDLRAEGLDGIPGKFIETTLYAHLPLIDYVFAIFEVQWYPEPCPVNGLMLTSELSSDGYYYYFGGNPTCTYPGGTPVRVDFTGIVPPGAEQMRIAVGVITFCYFNANCSGGGNTTPWFDNVRLGVHGTKDAPFISTRSIDRPQDAFPELETLTMYHPGRIDCSNVLGAMSPEPGTSVGDTLVVQGAGADVEVYVQFAIHPGPGVDPRDLGDYLSRVTFAESRGGLDWYAARLDTAEFGGSVTPGTWMTAFHESDPGFRGSDTDLDPYDLSPKGMTRLRNDIFPDDLLTPGSRLMLFYKTRYTGEPAWFTDPDTTDGTYYEMEVLPTSMDNHAFNCVLYVDHFDGLTGADGAQGFIEDALQAVLPGGSANWENTAWDRWDVNGPASLQLSFARPSGTEYGASTVQALAYRTILWNSGHQNEQAMSSEDAQLLRYWLVNDNNFYLSGDGAARSLTLDDPDEPGIRDFLENYLGVIWGCDTFRDADCPPGSPEDAVSCVEIDPVSGARVATRPQGGQPMGQGNSCPAHRSFDVIQPNPEARYGSPLPDEEYVGPAKTAPYASVSNQAASSSGNAPQFRSVVDGLSPHYRRDSGNCVGDAGAPQAVEERLQEVLEWFGYAGDAGGCGYRTTDIPVRYLPPNPPTRLANITPNPVARGHPATLRFSMSRRGRAELALFDIRGRLVRSLFAGEAGPGWNEVTWDGADATGRRVAGGVYFYRFRAEGQEFSRKVVVVD